MTRYYLLLHSEDTPLRSKQSLKIWRVGTIFFLEAGELLKSLGRIFLYFIVILLTGSFSDAMRGCQAVAWPGVCVTAIPPGPGGAGGGTPGGVEC